MTAVKFFLTTVIFLFFKKRFGIPALSKLNDGSCQASPLTCHMMCYFTKSGGLIFAGNWKEKMVSKKERKKEKDVEERWICENGDESACIRGDYCAVWNGAFSTPLHASSSKCISQVPSGIKFWIQITFTWARLGRWKWDKGHPVAVGSQRFRGSVAAWAIRLGLSPVSWRGGQLWSWQ